MKVQELSNQLKVCKNSDAAAWVSTVLKKHEDRITLSDAEHILDYFDAVPNKKLMRMSVDVALRLSKEWVERLAKKGKGIIETEEDVEVFMQFNNGNRFVKLVSQDAYSREGNLMSHCVGSYHGKGVSVYSLRDSNNNPHCTIEVSNDDVNQIKGKGNGSIHPKYIKYVLKFLEKVNKLPRESEMIHLGYTTLSEDTWKLIDTKVKGAKYLTFGGKRYLYVHSTLDLIPEISL